MALIERKWSVQSRRRKSGVLSRTILHRKGVPCRIPAVSLAPCSREFRAMQHSCVASRATLNKSIDWIRQQTAGEAKAPPFFAYQGMNIVLPPYRTSAYYYGAVDPAKVDVPVRTRAVVGARTCCVRIRCGMAHYHCALVHWCAQNVRCAHVPCSFIMILKRVLRGVHVPYYTGYSP